MTFVGIFSKGILKTVPNLEKFLGYKIILNPKSPENLIAVAGWGYKDTAKKAMEVAKKWNLPYWALEEGFIRSLTQSEPPISIIVDPIGIYYDSTRPSLLENLLNNDETFKPDILDKGYHILNLVKKYKISKYNIHKPLDKSIFRPYKHRVLIVDQTYGDMSVILGKSDKESFEYMLNYAFDRFSSSDLYIKVHPRVITGEKKGYLAKIKDKRVKIIYENYNPYDLLEYFDTVLTVSSQLGFEAILMDKEVICFGVPFYSGWGLTKDIQKPERRLKKRTILELFTASYVLYPTYCINLIDAIKFIQTKKEGLIL